MPEIISIEDFKTLPTDVEVGTIVVRADSLGGQAALRRSDRDRSWFSIDVETVAVSGGGPYQDTTTTYHVTFSGGSPSAARGWELTFATRPPFNARLYPSVLFSSSTMTIDDREREHYQRIRELVRPLLGYQVDPISDENMLMGAIYLKSFTLVAESYFSTTYSFVTCKPNMS